MMVGALWHCVCADSQFLSAAGNRQTKQLPESPVILANHELWRLQYKVIIFVICLYKPGLIAYHLISGYVFLDTELFIYLSSFYQTVSTSHIPFLLSLCFLFPPTAAVLLSTSVHFIALLDPCHLCLGTQGVCVCVHACICCAHV